MTEQELENVRLRNRLVVDEQLLQQMSVLQLCGSSLMGYHEVKRLVDEFLASGVEQT